MDNGRILKNALRRKFGSFFYPRLGEIVDDTLMTRFIVMMCIWVQIK